MRAVTCMPDDGGRLVVGEHPVAEPGPGQVSISVVAAGINRADLLQRRGSVHLPPGASEILGMEVSGTVARLGPGVPGEWLGRDVVALLASGGYAEQVVADVGCILPVPRGVDPVHAAGLPEVAATVVSNLLMVGRYRKGETVLIHGATGGIGSFAVQLMHALGARVAVTAGSGPKLVAAEALGADLLINHRTEDFVEVMEKAGGADLILDTVAGTYLARNLKSLRTNGRIVTIGMQGAAEETLDFRLMMQKKATVSGTLLRDRSLEEKNLIMRRVHEVVWPLVEAKKIALATDSIHSLERAEDAHRRMSGGNHRGKLLLVP